MSTVIPEKSTALPALSIAERRRRRVEPVDDGAWRNRATMKSA